MRYIRILIGFVFCFSAQSQTVNLYYTNSGFGGLPIKNALVTLTPLAPFANYSNSTLSQVPIQTVTDTNGAAYFSNIVSGYTYLYTVATPYTNYYKTNGFPSGLSGTVNGANYFGVQLTPQLFTWYFPSVFTNGLGAAGQIATTDGTNIFWANSTGGGSALQTTNGSGITIVTNGSLLTIIGQTNLFDLAGTSTNALLKANNLSDVANRRNASTNIGPQLSASGGDTALTDYTNNTPLFEGQLALFYYPNKFPNIAFAGSTTKGDYAHAFAFPAGFGGIGLSGIDLTSHGPNGIYPDQTVSPNYVIIGNGGPAGWAKNGDSTVIYEDFSTNNQNSGGGFSAAIMSQYSDTHLAFALDSVGFAMVSVPTNKLAALDPGYGLFAWNTHASSADSNMLGVVFASPGQWGWDSQNTPFLVLDSASELIRVPLWKTNGMTPLTGLGAANTNWADSLLINPKNGNVWITNGILSCSNLTFPATGRITSTGLQMDSSGNLLAGVIGNTQNFLPNKLVAQYSASGQLDRTVIIGNANGNGIAQYGFGLGLVQGSVVFGHGDPADSDRTQWTWIVLNHTNAANFSTSNLWVTAAAAFSGQQTNLSTMWSYTQSQTDAHDYYGNVNNYFQLWVQNTNSGTHATTEADFANNLSTGNSSFDYVVATGINSSGNTDYFVGAQNDGFLFGGTNVPNLWLGSVMAGSTVRISPGGGPTNSYVALFNPTNIIFSQSLTAGAITNTGHLHPSTSDIPAGSLTMTGADGNLTNLTIGANLTLSGTTLSGSAGGTGAPLNGTNTWTGTNTFTNTVNFQGFADFTGSLGVLMSGGTVVDTNGLIVGGSITSTNGQLNGLDAGITNAAGFAPEHTNFQSVSFLGLNNASLAASTLYYIGETGASGAVGKAIIPLPIWPSGTGYIRGYSFSTLSSDTGNSNTFLYGAIGLGSTFLNNSGTAGSFGVTNLITLASSTSGSAGSGAVTNLTQAYTNGVSAQYQFLTTNNMATTATYFMLTITTSDR